jgi:hypothetical protein
VNSINKRIKAYGLIGDFKQLKKYNDEYDKRFYMRVELQKKKLNALTGNNGIHFLQRSLQRSRYLYLGLLSCFEFKNSALSFLATRAHFEVTGSVAYFFWYLNKLYNDKISIKKINDLLGALLLGGKTFPDKIKQPERPDAINVLTQIDTADKVFAEMNKGENIKIFRDCYDFLSEACHPNFLGLVVGSDEFKDGNILFQKKIDFGDNDLNLLVPYMLISCSFFFHVYDKCFKLLEKNEIMPYLYK